MQSRCDRSRRRTARPFFVIESLALRFTVGVCCAGIALAGGCGPGVPAGKVVVTGRVTLDGGPLPEGHRSHLLLQARDSKSSGTARVEKDGRFRAVLDPGEYDVVAMVRDGEDRTDPVKGPVLAQSLIAKKYDSLTTSGLAVTVKPGVGPVVFDLSR